MNGAAVTCIVLAIILGLILVAYGVVVAISNANIKNRRLGNVADVAFIANSNISCRFAASKRLNFAVTDKMHTGRTYHDLTAVFTRTKRPAKVPSDVVEKFYEACRKYGRWWWTYCLAKIALLAPHVSQWARRVIEEEYLGGRMLQVDRGSLTIHLRLGDYTMTKHDHRVTFDVVATVRRAIQALRIQSDDVTRVVLLDGGINHRTSEQAQTRTRDTTHQLKTMP